MLFCKYKWPDLFIQNRLTLEQKELCRCRLKLLTYLDRLATYEVGASFNQASYVYLVCHYKCCGCPNTWHSWSLELLRWEKFIMSRNRFSCVPVLVKLEVVKGQSDVVSLGNRSALATSLYLFPASTVLSFTFILYFNFKVTEYSCLQYQILVYNMF